MADTARTAVRALRAGRLAVYPTDTLWGLGARATDAAALRRLTAAKGRPGGLPVSIAVSSYEELEPWAKWTESRRAFVRRELPGAVTLILPASTAARRAFAPGVVGPEGSIGLRIPDHPIAREIARQVGPITCTSANRHGEPPVRSVRAARRQFGKAVAAYVDGLPRPTGTPSVLADLRGAEPHLLARK